jgi:flavin reductase (DIM6/NTAB) family NADH-FMN oxidoreductase RutF
MKHEIGVVRPAHCQESWPGKYQLFSWLEYATTIPYPTFLITTVKANGVPNACWHSWGSFAGDGEGYYCVVTLLDSYHTYDNILRAGEWCVNLPTLEQRAQCERTIEHNTLERDEIGESGFTAEPSQVIASPRIAECPVSMECRLEWHHPLAEVSRWHVFAGRIVHAAIDDAVLSTDPGARLQAMNTMYNVRSTLDPLTGETQPGTLGILRLP